MKAHAISDSIALSVYPFSHDPDGSGASVFSAYLGAACPL